MTGTQREQYSKRLYSTTPFIGGWLRRKAVKALARDGSPESARLLAEAVMHSDDKQVHAMALKALRQLTDQRSIDAVCAIWADTRNADLAQLLFAELGWVAITPVRLRVLSALKVGRSEVVTTGGAEVIEPLLKACEDVDTDIACRARQCLVNLQNPYTIDAICERWVKKQDALLTQAVMQAGYMGREPISWVRVLSALKVGMLEVVTTGGAEVIEPLLQACEDTDAEIARRARQCLMNLQDSYTIDAICVRWAEKREPLLTQAVMQGGYVAKKPIAVRVLSALKVGRLEVVTEGGAEVVKPLLKACEDADQTIAERARLALRQLKNPEAQEEVCRLVLEQNHPLAREVTVTTGYAPRDPHQRALFYFLTEQQEAPPVRSVHILRRMRGVVWLPEREEEQVGFTELVRLAEACVDEVPQLGGLMRWQATLEFKGAVEPLAISPLTKAPSSWFSSPVKGVVECLAISPDSRVLASGREGDRVGVWSLPEGRLLKTLGFRTRDAWEDWGESVTCLAISPGGQVLAIGISIKGGRWEGAPPAGSEWGCSWDYSWVSIVDEHRVIVWSLSDGKPLTTLEEHNAKCLVFSPDGRLLASLSQDSVVRLWRLPDGKLLTTLAEHRGYFTCLAISLDGQVLASGSDDGMVRLWRLPDGKLLTTLTGHTRYVNCLAITPDAQLLASGSSNHKVRLWWLSDGKLLTTLEGHTGGVSCLAISPDGKVLASGSVDKTVRLWNLPDGKPLATLEGHTGGISCLAISPDGKALASGSSDGTVRLWDLNLLRLLPLGRLPVRQTSLEDLAWAQEALRNESLTDAERSWLEFIEALMHWHRRFDIDVEGEHQPH